MVNITRYYTLVYRTKSGPHIQCVPAQRLNAALISEIYSGGPSAVFIVEGFHSNLQSMRKKYREGDFTQRERDMMRSLLF
jgi:hypothetical protein